MDLAWRGGGLTRARLQTTHDTDCLVRYGAAVTVAREADDAAVETTVAAAGAVRFQTAAGEAYLVHPRPAADAAADAADEP